MRFLLALVFTLFVFAHLSAQCTDADDYTFVVNPPLPPAGYAPGTVVNMCFTLEGYTNVGANWVHSILPTFGAGFNLASLVPGAPPASCVANGSWAWYSSFTTCEVGNVVGPGFAFDSSGGVQCGGTANDGNPGNNFGDGPAFCLRTFCWDITTVAANTCVNEAFLVGVEVNSDSETGSYGTRRCFDDERLCWPTIEDLSIDINSPCPGDDFVMNGSFSNAASCGLQVEWLLNGAVVGTGLTYITDVEGTYTFRINSNGCAPVETMVTATYGSTPPTLSPNGIVDYCFGDQVTLTATGGTSYRYNGPSGQVSMSNPFTFTANAAAEGTWTVTIINGSSTACQQQLDVFIIVAPELFPMGTANPNPVCVGETVTLTGTGAGPGGSYEWTLPNGGQTFDNPYVYTTESAGTNNVTLTVFDGNTGNCTEDVMFSFLVNPLPNAQATAQPSMSCENAPVQLTASGGVSYQWSTGQTGSSISVIPSPPQETYQVTVTSAAGCEEVADVTVIVQATLDAPDINCEEINPTRLDFTWNDVSGADYYQIFISINGGPFNLVENQYFGTSYTVSNLSALTDVEIRIIPFTFANPACPGSEGTTSCATPDCNPVTIFLEDGMTGPYCYTVGSNDPIELAAEVNAMDNGRLYWSGPGIFFESNPVEFFPPGLGNFDLTVHFELDDGSCPFEETFTIAVVGAASADFTVSETQVCANETVTVSLNGAANNAATYTWNFGGATVNSGSGNAGPYVLSFPAAGPYTVSLMTTLGQCTDMEQVQINVGAPIVAPTVTCQLTTQDSIIFAWNDVPGATGYTVNLISGPAGTVVGNTYVVSGLAFGQQVEISVTALGTAFCDAATSTVRQCEAQSCPVITLDVTTPPQTFCLTNQNDPVLLEFTTDNPSNPTDTVWSGPGVVGNTFDPDLAGVGTHRVRVTVTDDNCPFSATVDFIVRALPTSTFTLPTEACVDGDVNVQYTGSADPLTTTFNWDFDGGTIVSGTGGGPYVINWSTPGTYQVTLALNDGNCASMESQNTIMVIDSLPRPTVNCINPGLDEVTFEWTIDPNATGYTVTVINGPAGTQTGNRYRVTGLAENDEVTIEVVATNTGVCGNSLPTRITCQARSCPPILVEIDNPPADFCADNTGTTVDLMATISGSIVPGNLSWSGPGVSGSTFAVDNANTGPNVVIATYVEDGCTYADTVEFTLFDVPVAAFSADLTEACVGQAVVLNFTGAMLLAGSNYNWDFAGGNASPGTGVGPHTVTWNTPGQKVLSLVVTENGCVSEPFILDIDIVAPLPAPALACGEGSVDSVSFSWNPIAGALGYVITIDGGQPDTITTTSIGVGGLIEGQQVSATVYALGAAPCNDGPPITEVCTAAVCPELTIVIDEANNQVCEGVAEPFQVLGIAQNSGSGNGTYVWSGMGVSNDTFFYGGLAPGDYEVVVLYQEGLCPYRDTAIFTVLPEPIANYTIAADSICLLENNTITYVGTALAGDTYNWDFDGGSAVPGTGPGPHSVAWDTPGIKTVSLIVTEGLCTSPVFMDTVIVIDTIAAPILSCGDSVGLNFLTVVWDPVVGAVNYEILVDGVIRDTITDTIYVLSGLLPGHTCDITVRPLGVPGSISCGGNASTITCSSLACEDISFDFSANPTAFCLLTGVDQSFTLTASVSGGSGFGDFIWSGNGVTGDTFDPALAGVGEHVIDLAFIDFAGPCLGAGQFTISVFEVPVADFSSSADPVCADELVTITFTGTAPAGADFAWNAGGNLLSGQGPHQVSFPDAGIFNIDLTVTAATCTSTATTQTINVIAPLAAPNVQCTGAADLNSITVSWNDVTPNAGYQILVDGNVVDTVSVTTYTVANLLPATEVMVSVVAISTGPCPDSAPGVGLCTSAACPPLSADFSGNPTTFCLDITQDQSFVLAAVVGSGANQGFVWSGPGVTGNIFDPAIAGVGNHFVVLNYSETGPCTFVDSFLIQVFEVPVATFGVSTDLACTDETITVTFTGSAPAGSVFNWTVSNGAVLVGPGPHVINSATAASITVNLTVTSNGCPATATEQTVAFVAPLGQVMVSCTEQQLEQVTFSWAAVTGATQYIVERSGQTPDTITATTYTVAGLVPEQNASITVRALGTLPCGDGPTDTEQCAALPCPTIAIAIDVPVQEFCLTDDVAPINLGLSTTGGDQSGSFTVTGNGVVSSGNGFLFDPAIAGVGSHLLEVTYTETAGCGASNSIELHVFAVPDVAFNNFATVICQTGETTIQLTNTDNGPFPEVTWITDGGLLTELPGNTFTISWAEPGQRSVTLNLERNGCTNSYTFPITIERQATAGNQMTQLSICAGTGELVELSALLEGADAGGVWTARPGSPATVDATTGQLITANVAAGMYTYRYTIQGNACETSVADVTIEIQPAPVANTGLAQTLTCDMGMVSLNGSGSTGSGDLQYLWTGPNGQQGLIVNPTSPMIDVSLPGTYVLTVTSDIGCSASSSVLVTADTEVPIPQIELSNISCFSADDGAILVASVVGGRPPYSYSLNGAPAMNSSFFTGLAPAEYSLRVRDANGCFSDLFLDVSEPEQLSISIDLPNDNADYNVGERVVLTASISGGNTIDTLIWQPDTLNQSGEGNSITFIASETQQVMVTVVDELGCRATDVTTIFVRRDDPVYIPSGISPNGDNVNDVLYIGADPDRVLLVESFLIFNRWGEAVYQNYDFLPNEPAQGWDGTHRGETLNPEVFVYVAVIEMTDGSKVVYKGDITLLR